ncbi:DUF58 domain-containing protein [Mesoterricola sediminis]|uniref:DUF58 domain-containing protein n=1 Tax=Mesoterricola sediminis TaxID=2927980 RepID=A0AA48H4F8_9BACT|nr:DUF58 domain-containing protein [Mesoterricola sediminis]BDU77266.1 hypothetical protein METESE_22240 [Mesoterricola sediminis]
MRPARPLLALAAAWFALAGLAVVWPAVFHAAWAWSGGGLIALAALDAGLAWRLRAPGLDRQVAAVLPVGTWSVVRLRAAATGRRTLRIFDDLPGSFEVQGLPVTLEVPAQGWAEVRYRVRPGRRGPFAFGAAHALLASPLGLWWRGARLGGPTPVRVFPDFSPVKVYAELARSQRLADMGIHRRRRRGEGSEFHQLRDYRAGDSLRQLDWKATARLGRLISRDYQEERDQQVICLLDCGRRLRAREGRASHFDHMLTALLLLAIVALREGDAVGLLTFGGPVRFVPPRKTPKALDGLLDVLYGLDAGLEPTDFLEAARALLARVRKRSLVVLITDARDEDDETLLPALRLLAGRHRVVLASLRDPALDAALEAVPATFEAALRTGSVLAYLERRRRTFLGLSARGWTSLDVPPRQLAVALANRYLAEKRG